MCKPRDHVGRGKVQIFAWVKCQPQSLWMHMDAQTCFKKTHWGMLWRSCTHVFRVCGFEHERTGNGEIETAVGWMNIFLAFLLWFGVWQTSATFSMHLTQPKQSFLSPSESLDVAILRSLMVLLPRRWNCKWESRDHLLQTLGNWRCVAGVSHPVGRIDWWLKTNQHQQTPVDNESSFGRTQAGERNPWIDRCIFLNQA